MCNGKKDFSLLRPFDMEAAKSGEAVCWYIDGEVPDEFHVSKGGNITVIWKDEDQFVVWTKNETRDYFRMAPLCWVRTSVEDGTLKPVYKGDVLWHKYGKEVNKVIADSLSDYITPSILEKGSGIGWHIECLTFTPPKVKREIKMLGYKDVFDGGILLRDVVIEDQSYWKRFPQIDTTIEIEE